MVEETGYISAGFLLSVVSFFKKDRRTFPVIIERALSWFAAVLLAIYLGCCYVISTRRSILRVWPLTLLIGTVNNQGLDDLESCHHVSLTTTTRGNETTFADALDQLEKLLETLYQKKDVTSDNENEWKDAAGLTSLMRSSVEARRLASMAMKLQLRARTENTHGSMMDSLSNSQTRLWKQLEKLWPQLLQLPSSTRKDDQEYPFQISVVVPAYAEQGKNMQANLQRALTSSQHPSRIQLVVVDAGKNTDMGQATVFEKGDPRKTWGDIQLVSFTAGGGRGPTLNFGAQHATGKIITFLHSDNILPDEWDEQITSTFNGHPDKESPSSNNTERIVEGPTPKPIACAFSFKINASKKALNGGEYPPGLAAAQWLGTVRTERFHVLYGDSVLSMPAAYFRYIGGYPDQALMEDYEVMDLLRKRVTLSSSCLSNNETVCILPSETLISPRRWQVNGVPYVILFNCLCVFLYEHRGWSPEELYKFYYQRRSSSS